MKLIANVTTHLDASKNRHFVLIEGQEYNFEPDRGGGLYSEDLHWIISDPCLALWTLRLPEAPTPALDLCEGFVRLYMEYGMEDGCVSGILGTRFNVLCWNAIPGEFEKNRIYEMEIMDTFGCGTDGFISESGYVVDTVEEALNHFILVK